MIFGLFINTNFVLVFKFYNDVITMKLEITLHIMVNIYTHTTLQLVTNIRILSRNKKISGFLK